MAASPIRPRRRKARTEPILHGVAASYSRYSSDLQDASSIDQQQRKCREKAAQDGTAILPELEFADAAVSGTKRERTGLNALLAAARAGRFGTLYFESLSRLARESVITMPMLKELVYVLRVRVISVSEGIDSNQSNWELMASFMAWVHEQYLKTLRAAVLRGQEQAVLNDWSVGDWPFGYGSEPVPGTEQGRKGRHPRPRMRAVVHEDHARWVRRIFHWFVGEQRHLDWIARELTRLNAPKGRRSTAPGWHHDCVKRVLRNEKYIGIWTWGRLTNVRNPLTGQVLQEERPAAEVARWVRERPHLRLIDDVTFFKAQALLDESAAKWAAVRSDSGQLRGSTPAAQRPRHLLQGLFECSACGRTFQVSGANGKYLGCAGYQRGLCRCKTRLPRRQAEEQLLAAVSHRVLSQPAWFEAVFQEALRSWGQHQQQGPTELGDIDKRLTSVNQVIQRLVDAVEQGEGVIEELRDRLAQRKRELQRLRQEQACLQATRAAPAEPPTQDWVASELRCLREVLQASGTAANAALRRLIGGRVTVEEAVTPGRRRKRLVGKFTLTTKAVLPDPGARSQCVGSAALKTEEVVVAFREESPWAAIAEEVKQRYDGGQEYKRIAVELTCHRSWVAKALAWWHSLRGLPVPDGRRQRGRLQRPTLAEKLADAAKGLWDGKLLMQEIALRLGCDRDTVKAALRHWFESRGLAMSDGRTRRKELPRNGVQEEAPRLPDQVPTKEGTT